MPSQSESLALYPLHALYHATGGKPQEWRMLEELDGTTAEAIVFAVVQGWVVVQGGHSICRTDAGRGLVEPR